MFSKTRLPKLIGLRLRSVRGEWVAQKICPSRIFAFADLSGPMLSGNRHQAHGGLVVSWHPRPTGWDADWEAASDLNLAERSNSPKGQRTENEFSSLSRYREPVR